MITVAVIEDHQILIDALNLMFSTEEDFDFVGAASTIASGIDLIKRTTPHVLLLDIHLPDGNGLNFVPEINTASPQTQIVVLTGQVNEKLLLRAVDAKVSGFLSKECSLPELLFTIRKASQGEICMPSHMLVDLLRQVPRRQSYIYKDDQLRDGLTPREHEILIYLAQGISGDEIAAELHIAPLTVRTHIRNMMSKLGVHSRLEAVSYAFSEGLIELST